MKNKIIIFLVIFVLFAPVVSSAIIVPNPQPQTNLTVVINAPEKENFNINLQVKDDNNIDWDNFFNFSDVTDNLYYSRIITLSPVGKEYWLEKEVSFGGITKYLHCTSDNQGDVFFT